MKRKFNFFMITAFVIFFAIASDIFIVYQLNNYETRFLEIYGEKQNGDGLSTYDKLVLEDNILLECKNSIIIILSLVLALLVILSMVMSQKINRQGMQIEKQEEHAVWQNQQIMKLDEQLKREYAFGARRHVFHPSVLDEFLETLQEKGVRPLHFAVFETESEEAQNEFFEHMQVVLDNRVLRFSMDEQKALLIFAGYEKAVSERIIQTLKNWRVHALADLYCEEHRDSYKRQFYEFWEAVTGK